MPNGFGANGRVMIRVKMFAPLFIKISKTDERGWMELPDNSTLKDALKINRVPRIYAKFMNVTINGETMPLNTVLHDGDVIGFFSLLVAG